jgi:hypothetical protein
MADEPGTRNERRDMLVFLGFIVSCVTVVLIVLIVNDDWPERRWVAIGAVAACVQAIAVAIALPYGYSQLRIMRTQRRDPIIDRLDDAMYSRLIPSAERQMRTWTRCNFILSTARDTFLLATPDVYDRMLNEFDWPRFKESYDTLEQSHAEVTMHVKAVARLMAALEIARFREIYRLRIIPHQFDSLRLPHTKESFQRLIESDKELDEPDVAEYRKALKELEDVLAPIFERRSAAA